MTREDKKQLEIEIKHIFESGVNELRIYNMVVDFIEKRYESDVISSDCLCYRDDEGMIVLCDKCLKELTGIN